MNIYNNLCEIMKLDDVHTGTDPNLAAAYVSAGLPQFATSALSTPSALGNMTLSSATGTASIGKQIEGKCKHPDNKYIHTKPNILFIFTHEMNK